MDAGVDVGGTFTDFVIRRGDALEAFKLPSTAEQPEAVVLEGLRDRGVTTIGHGTTVATNAVIEGRGARTALLTTAGFEDLLEIGRQKRPKLYDFRAIRPDPLVPAARTFGLEERIDVHGEVLRPLTRESVESLVAALESQGVESVAISLLSSFANRDHEALAAEVLHPHFHVSRSSEVLPEFREYERTSTTVLDALVAPLVRTYLAGLMERLGARVFVMRSNGGIREAQNVMGRPVEMILSGPAGGVAGARSLAATLGLGNAMSLDMGGTSADISLLVEGQPVWTTDAEIGGNPLALPVLDITTIGAGGGSIAWVDAGGALRVGPRSAGADPGPLCYDRGGEQVTLTDVDLVSGILGPALLGGRMPLSPARAAEGVADLALSLGMKEDEVLRGVRTVVVSNMVRAAGLAFARRGLDPREFALIAFGGAGPMHALEVARELGMRVVIVPPLPGAFSASGILGSEIRLDYGQSLVLPYDATAGARIEAFWERMDRRAAEELNAQGVRTEEAVFLRTLDLRYRGQSYEINVPAAEDPAKHFHRLHETRYGYAMPEEPLEVVNVRLAAVVDRSPPPPTIQPTAEGRPTKRRVLLGRKWRSVPIHSRGGLAPGFEAEGPLIVEEETATTVVDRDASLHVDASGSLRIEVT